jgi:hypothetical protein
MNARWTIRNISGEARAMMDEMHEATGIPYGRLLTQAIQHWYASLPKNKTLLQLIESWAKQSEA